MIYKKYFSYYTTYIDFKKIYEIQTLVVFTIAFSRNSFLDTYSYKAFSPLNILLI